jgi:ligand-binding sensor domain-containing protein
MKHLPGFLLWLFLIPAAYGQHPLFNSRRFTYNDLELHTRSTFQDRQGFIWLAASEGLFRYDGAAVEHYILPGNDSLPGITALYEDHEHTLWIGTSRGHIYRMQRGIISQFDPEEGLPKVAVTAFASDRLSRLWIATYGEGIYCHRDGRLYNINTDDGLSDDYVYTMVAHPTGIVICGTDAGINLVRFTDKKQVKVIDQSEGLPDNIITSLALYGAAGVLAGTESKGVAAVNLVTGAVQVHTGSAAWNNGSVVSIVEAPGSWLYATTTGGLIETSTDGTIIAHYNAAGTAVPDKLSSVMRDAEGNIWLCNLSSSITTYSRQFSFLPMQHANLYMVLRDSRGTIWFSDNNRLGAITGKGKEELPAQLRSIAAISACEDAKGCLWFGTFGKGVYRYDPATRHLTQFTEADGLVNNNVLSIAGDQETIWFATLGGVSSLGLNSRGKAAFNAYNRSNGMPASYVYQVYIDSQKRVWFATDGFGLIRYEAKKGFRRISTVNGLRGKVVYSITEDAGRTLWVNAAREGLFYGDGTTFRPYKLNNTKQEIITSVFADRSNNLLLVHAGRIDVLNTHSGMLLRHSDELGLEHIEPNLNAGCTDREGNIWIASSAGIVRYTPDQGNLWKGPLPVIKKVSLFLSPVNKDTEHTFAYNNNHISFDYTGLWFHDPDEVVYEIKLEGYDPDWIRTKDRNVVYPKLPPGAYTFRVKVSADASQLHATETSYSFSISAPFWSTWWFILTVIMAASATVYLLVTQRIAKLRERQNLEKESISFQFETLKSQINPHFLFNSFNTLAGLIESDPQHAVSYVGQLSDFYRSILQYRDKDVITLKEELEILDNYFALQQKRYGSKLSMHTDEDLYRQQAYIAPLTLQLLVENAIKHNVVSAEKPLAITLNLEDDYLVVRNNFQPKLFPEKTTGLGLENIRSRYRIISPKTLFTGKDDAFFTVRIPLIYSI